VVTSSWCATWNAFILQIHRMSVILFCIAGQWAPRQWRPGRKCVSILQKDKSTKSLKSRIQMIILDQQIRTYTFRERTEIRTEFQIMELEYASNPKYWKPNCRRPQRTLLSGPEPRRPQLIDAAEQWQVLSDVVIRCCTVVNAGMIVHATLWRRHS